MQMKFPLTKAAPKKDDRRKVWLCDVCGAEFLDLHCKLRCTNCGFMRDCSDP